MGMASARGASTSTGMLRVRPRRHDGVWRCVAFVRQVQSWAGHEPRGVAEALVRAGHARHLTREMAREICENSMAHLDVKAFVHMTMEARMSWHRRDMLLCEMVRALLATDKMRVSTLLYILRASHAKYVPRTRDVLHAFLQDQGDTSAHTRQLWRAVLRSHRVASEWHKVDDGLRTSVAKEDASELDVYHYTLHRLRFESQDNDKYVKADDVLVHMRQSGTKLDDRTLVQLLHILMIPVYRAYRTHQRPRVVMDAVRPARRAMQATFRWLRGDGASPTRLGRYRLSAAEILEFELFFAYVQHMCQRRYLFAPPAERCGMVPAEHLAPLHAKLDVLCRAWGERDVRVKRLRIMLHASGGAWARACRDLEAWLADDASQDAAFEQRRLIVTMFGYACKHTRYERLESMAELLRISARCHLWRDGASPAPGATLVRLWLRFVAAWTKCVGVNCGHARRAHMARSRYGWELMSRALPHLTAMARCIQIPCARVWDHPERCRSLVRAGRLAGADLSVVDACLDAIEAPPRIRRWAHRAACRYEAEAPSSWARRVGRRRPID